MQREGLCVVGGSATMVLTKSKARSLSGFFKSCFDHLQYPLQKGDCSHSSSGVSSRPGRHPGEHITHNSKSNDLTSLKTTRFWIVVQPIYSLVQPGYSVDETAFFYYTVLSCSFGAPCDVFLAGKSNQEDDVHATLQPH
jgi:hypothetical protein